MKIYFTASIAQKPKFGKYYRRIIKTLEKQGHKVLAENVLRLNVKAIQETPDSERIKWYQKALRHIRTADLIVIEISFPSTVNVGHELSVALERGKPVIALYKENRDPIFLRGMDEEKLILYPYNDDNLEDVLINALEDAIGQMDVRFNFFISPKIGAYLDWIAKHKKLPRAVFLRKLIEEHMKRDKEYK